MTSFYDKIFSSTSYRSGLVIDEWENVERLVSKAEWTQYAPINGIARQFGRYITPQALVVKQLEWPTRAGYAEGFEVRHTMRNKNESLRSNTYYIANGLLLGAITLQVSLVEPDSRASRISETLEFISEHGLFAPQEEDALAVDSLLVSWALR